MEVKKITSHLDFTKREERLAFIKENDGLFSGTNVDGETVIVEVTRSVEAKVKTIHSSKPNWYEVAYYDENGEATGQSYEHL